MTSFTNIPRLLLTAFLALLLGFLGYTALANHYAYRSLLSQTPSMRYFVQNTPALSYGVVESIDVTERTITVRVPAKNTMDIRSRLFRYSVSEDAYIARQELKGTNGVYEALSPPVLALLSDVRVGDNVAVLDQNKQGQFVASVILFGNPL